jgi:hypothetical protein
MFTFTQDTRHSALFTRCVEQLLLLQEQCEESTHVIANGRIYCVSEFRTQKEPFRQEGYSKEGGASTHSHRSSSRPEREAVSLITAVDFADETQTKLAASCY